MYNSAGTSFVDDCVCSCLVRGTGVARVAKLGRIYWRGLGDVS